MGVTGNVETVDYIRAWWRLSRMPFLFVGILPLILGFILAWRWGYRGPTGLYLLALLAVVLIMWMSYYLGEWNDFEGDLLNQTFNPYSGGSRVLVQGILSPKFSLFLGYGCLIGAILIGMVIYLRYRTGHWTLILGGCGIVCGFFYSNRPFRWSYRGAGEILIGFCYGWLPVATGFYLFTGFFKLQILLLSIPFSLTIITVILMNEFPDEVADRAVGKKNLVVRFGKERAGDFYMGLSVLGAFTFIKVLLVYGETPLWIWAVSGIPLGLILRNLVQVLREEYQNAVELEQLCRHTLWVNLSIGVILILHQATL